MTNTNNINKPANRVGILQNGLDEVIAYKDRQNGIFVIRQGEEDRIEIEDVASLEVLAHSLLILCVRERQRENVNLA